MNKFPEILTNLRKKRGLTQKALAKELDISTSALSMYESNNREPSFKIKKMIADYFDVDFNYQHGVEPKSYPSKFYAFEDIER